MRAWRLLLVLGCGFGCGDDAATNNAGAAGNGGGAGTMGGASATTGGTGGGGAMGGVGAMGGTGAMGGGGTGVPPMSNTGCTLEGPFTQMGEALLARSGVIGIEPTDDAIYFITRSSVERLPLGATQSEVLVSDVAPARNTSRAESLLQVDATHVFWVEEGAIWAAPHTPPAAGTVLVDGLDDVMHIRVHGSQLYYATRQPYLLARVPLTGGAAEVLLEGDLLTDLEISDEHIYFATFSRHRAGRMPIEGGDPQWYSPDIDAPAAIAFDEMNVYWTSRHSMSATPLSMPGERTVLGQGTPAAIAAPSVNQMHVEGDRLYWLDDNYVIGWVATDGSDCGQVALGRDFNVHAGTLYASDDNDGIWRVTL